MLKIARLRQLAAKRKSANMEEWPGCSNIGDYHQGAYDEHDFVSPYSLSAHNEDAEVLLLLQDWASRGSMSERVHEKTRELGHDPKLVTNKRLKEWLGAFLKLDLADTWATNLFPFLKPGGMSAPIAPELLRRAAREYALPQIEIIQPRLVICFGLATFNAVRETAGLGAVGTRSAAVLEAFEHNVGDPAAGQQTCQVWCLPHPAARVAHDLVRAYWLAMAISAGRAGPWTTLPCSSPEDAAMLLAERAVLAARREARGGAHDSARLLVSLLHGLTSAFLRPEKLRHWLEDDLSAASGSHGEVDGVRDLSLLSHALGELLPR
jgi:uracil-DNA glycosylase